MQRVYVVLMRRWGDTETHSYIYGVYSNLEDSIDHAIAAEDERGGKYVAYIEEQPVNPSDSDRPKLYHTGRFPDFPREAVVWQHADLILPENSQINAI